MSANEGKKAERVLRVGTLFSGIGAFEQALKQMGVPFEIVFACDNGERYVDFNEQVIRKYAALTGRNVEDVVDGIYDRTEMPNYVKQSYEANYGLMGDRWHNDVRFMSGLEYAGKVDILVGGSPCQSFSTYGKKLGLDDARGTLFFDYARLIKEVNPSVFIYENVRGLKVHDKGNTWKVIKGVFESLDYEISEPQILNAQDYGLPQMRKRLFVVGVKKSLNKDPFVYPPKVKLGSKATTYLNDPDSVPIRYYLPEKGYKWVTEVDRSQNKARINRDIIGCQTAVQQVNWSGDFRMELAKSRHKKSRNVFVTRYDGPDEKLRAEFGDKEVVIRKLMPDECLRLMGFTDFVRADGLDDKVLYRQAGNSIAVPVLKALVKSILKQYFDMEVQDAK